VAASPQGTSGFADSQARMRSTGHLLSAPQIPDPGQLSRIDRTGKGNSPNMSDEESGTISSQPTLLDSRARRSLSLSCHSPGASANGSDEGTPRKIHAPQSGVDSSSPAQDGERDLCGSPKPARVDAIIDHEEERLMDAALPPILGPPLPINPRDTVFSVIEGYGHHRTNSDGASVLLPPVPPLPSIQQNGFPNQANFASTDMSGMLQDETHDVLAHNNAIGARESYASGLTDMSGTFDSEHQYENGELGNGLRHSSVSSDFEYQPPPPIIGADDIAAIARQPSPGRVEHGIPLQSRGHRTG